MMRTIKFRAKRKNGEWVIGNYVHHWFAFFESMKEEAIYVPKPDNGGYWVQDILPDTIGQYTGLYDCQGAEIYEGDIVQWKDDNRLYAVQFRWGMFYASVEVCNEEIYGGFPLHTLASQGGKRIEIVGNIFDNPELIKIDPNGNK